MYPFYWIRNDPMTLYAELRKGVSPAMMDTILDDLFADGVRDRWLQFSRSWKGNTKALRLFLRAIGDEFHPDEVIPKRHSIYRIQDPMLFYKFAQGWYLGKSYRVGNKWSNEQLQMLLLAITLDMAGG